MKQFNWWRISVIIFCIYLGIAAYSGGFWNSVKAVGLVFSLYQFGRFSYEHDATPEQEGAKE